MTGGMINSLGETIDLLGQILGQQILTIYGQSLHNKVEALRLRCKEVKNSQDLSDIGAVLSQYSVQDLKKLIHCFSVFFLLSNQAEQCEIIRIKRQRKKLETNQAPRSESIAEAVRTLALGAKIDSSRFARLLNQISVTPTLTAHPTEARRRSVLFKQLAVAEIIFKLFSPDLGELESAELHKTLKALILGLLVTDDVRANRLSVQDEVENGIFFLAGSVLEIVPEIMKDLDSASQQYFQQSFRIAPLVRYRSWIGGDRDGNPNVTASVTNQALLTHRKAIIKHYQKTIRALRDELSISTRKVSLPSFLEDSIRYDRKNLSLDEKSLIDPHQIFEPLREKTENIALKLEAELEGKYSYLEKEFKEDLSILQTALRDSGLSEISESGILGKLIYQADVFGFSLADLDIRQHSKVHESSISEILALSGICPDYSSLSEQQKTALLHNLLEAKNLEIKTSNLSTQSAETLAVFKLIFDLNHAGRSGLGAYVISMTHSVSDMLEPLVLWRLSGAPSSRPFPLDLSPLFETIEDLDRSGALLKAIVSDSFYKAQLAGRNNFQEIMLGYSDSNKDGGYAAANILLYEAQLQIAQVCLAHNINFQIFHGRGGSVGRGGGRAGRAILSSPPESQSGKVRFTEQGEVISFRYSMPELAHRHLEQIVSSVILSVGSAHSSLEAQDLKELKNLAEVARLKYRSLIDAPGFWEWYVGITPIKFISSLPIASRPVMRAGSNLEFENLRAIPWVFSWTQTRYNVPSWFGIGSAFSQLFESDQTALMRMQRLYKEKVFFQALIDNAQQEMARARLIIAEQYNFDGSEQFHKMIEEEFEKTASVILLITNQKELLDNNPVIKKSIATRNPYTDALNLIQSDLLKRARAATKNDLEISELREAIHISISALSAAMQTTG